MMKHHSQKAKKSLHVDDATIEQLGTMIHEIGVARFAGRIQSGLIDPAAGYAALSRFTVEQEKRPFLSEVADILFSRRVSSHR